MSIPVCLQEPSNTPLDPPKIQISSLDRFSSCLVPCLRGLALSHLVDVAIRESRTLPGRAGRFFQRFGKPITDIFIELPVAERILLKIVKMSSGPEKTTADAIAVLYTVETALAIAGAAILTKKTAEAAVNKFGDAVAQAMVGNDPLHGLQI